MIPFDMVRLDSNVTTQDGQRRKPAMDRILDLAKVSMMLTRKYDENCKNCMTYLVSVQHVCGQMKYKVAPIKKTSDFKENRNGCFEFLQITTWQKTHYRNLILNSSVFPGKDMRMLLAALFFKLFVNERSINM